MGVDEVLVGGDDLVVEVGGVGEVAEFLVGDGEVELGDEVVGLDLYALLLQRIIHMPITTAIILTSLLTHPLIHHLQPLHTQPQITLRL